MLHKQDAALRLLSGLIEERLGIRYDEAKFDILSARLESLLTDRGYPSILDFYYRMKYDDSHTELPALIDALSVPETYFWREPEHFRVLVEVLVPQILESSPGEPVRIWSAACATGEEPLTLAMALTESGWMDRVPVEIHATDASPHAISIAKRGEYRERSFRQTPPDLHEKYFERSGKLWKVDPALHSKVRWGVANLMCEADVRRFATVPIIFCRNVFIYFSPAAILSTVERFARAMKDPGYLFVGVAESLMKLTIAFRPVQISGAFLYLRNPQ